eukprot:10971241-Heterocapsa_arctica.AAC.1
MDAEYNKLEQKGVWDLRTVCEKSEVMAEASRQSVKCHFGMVFVICGEKGSELKLGDPGRKWKGRYVFRGIDVKDEHMQAAIFN